jgi:hypothetical protein
VLRNAGESKGACGGGGRGFQLLRAPLERDRPRSAARFSTARAMSSDTSRAQPSAVLKSTTRSGLLNWPVNPCWQDAAVAGIGHVAQSRLDQFPANILPHAAAPVLRFFFPTSGAMAITLAAPSVYALGDAIVPQSNLSRGMNDLVTR